MTRSTIRPDAREPHDATADLDSLAASVLRQECARFARTLGAARKGRRGAVHAFRIAARRLVAAIELSRAIWPGREWLEAEREVRQLFEACGRLRDLQVVHSALRRRRCQGRSPQLLLARTGERIKRHQKRLARYLDGARPHKICRQMQDLAATSAGTRRAARKHGTMVRAGRAVEAVLNRSRRNLQLACRRVQIDGPKMLHRARVVAKVHRYQLEIAPSLGAQKLKGELPGLRRLQKGLGAITDLMLLQAELARYVRKHPGARRELGALQERIERERGRRCAEVFVKAWPVRVAVVRARAARSARPD